MRIKWDEFREVSAICERTVDIRNHGYCIMLGVVQVQAGSLKLRSLPPPLTPGFCPWRGISWQCLGWPPCLPRGLWTYRAWSSLSAKLVSALCPKKASPCLPSSPSIHSSWVAGLTRPLQQASWSWHLPGPRSLTLSRRSQGWSSTANGLAVITSCLVPGTVRIWGQAHPSHHGLQGRSGVEAG